MLTWLLFDVLPPRVLHGLGRRLYGTGWDWLFGEGSTLGAYVPMTYDVGVGYDPEPTPSERTAP